MRVLITSLVFAACCNSGITIGVYSRENSRLLANRRNDAEFFQGIGDWFGNLKNRICEKWFGRTTTVPPPPLPTEVLDLDKFQLQKRLRNREWLQVDLSTLTFDLERDWGFRIGNWYFIRKGYKNNKVFEQTDSAESNFQSQDTPKQKNSGEIQDEASFENPRHAETTESISTMSTPIVRNIKQSTTQRSTTQSLLQTTLYTDSSEYYPTIMATERNNVKRGSAEVLMG